MQTSWGRRRYDLPHNALQSVCDAFSLRIIRRLDRSISLLTKVRSSKLQKLFCNIVVIFDIWQLFPFAKFISTTKFRLYKYNKTLFIFTTAGVNIRYGFLFRDTLKSRVPTQQKRNEPLVFEPTLYMNNLVEFHYHSIIIVRSMFSIISFSLSFTYLLVRTWHFITKFIHRPPVTSSVWLILNKISPYNLKNNTLTSQKGFCNPAKIILLGNRKH